MLKSPKLHIVIFILFICIVASSGIIYYDYILQKRKKEAYSNLSTLAELKLTQIENWITEKQNDAEYLYNHKYLNILLRNLLISPGRYTRNEIKELLTAFISRSDYTDVMIVTNAGKVISFFSDKKNVLSITEKSDVEECRNKKKPFISSLMMDSLNNIIMNSYIPLIGKYSGELFGVLILRINPERNLYPLITARYKDLNTAESFIVRRQGENVMFLNNLQDKKHLALRFILPLSNDSLPAARAIKGHKGYFEGIDYRGIRVLSDLHEIKNTSWFFVSKIDMDEVYSPIRQHSIYILSAALGIIIIVGLILHSAWENERAAYFKRQLETEKEKKNTEDQLVKSQALAHLGSWELNLENQILTWSDEVYRIFGYEPQEFYPTYDTFLQSIHPDERQIVDNAYLLSIENQKNNYEIEHRIIRKDGEIRYVHEKCEHYRDSSGKIVRSVGMVQDITDRKIAQQALLISEERFAKAFFANPNAMVISRLDDGKIYQVNDTFVNLFGYTHEETIGKTSLELNTYSNPADRNRIINLIHSDGQFRDLEINIRLKDGQERIALFSGELLHMNKEISLLTIIQDITSRKQAEQALRDSESKLTEAQRLANIGFYLYDINTGSLELSDEMYNIFGMEKSGEKLKIELFLQLIHKDDMESIKYFLNEAKTINKVINSEFRIETIHGTKYLYAHSKPIVNAEGITNYIFGTIMDITERKNSQLELEHTLNELRRSNKELEQFAYTASHDLQEPIRMVKSYAQLFEYTLFDKLNPSSRDYLKYITEGATRMQELVDGLLQYSRLATKQEKFMEVDCNKIINAVLKDLKIKILEECAQISVDHLPVVKGNEVQLRQLFQNLLSNSLKFRSDQDPLIRISCEKMDTQFLFTISDNGIGIEAQYYDKIFHIFQRLHEREKYPGTGIGLALCKKIVERHGGKIYVESEPGLGSIFHFTIPFNNNQPAGG